MYIVFLRLIAASLDSGESVKLLNTLKQVWDAQTQIIDFFVCVLLNYPWGLLHIQGVAWAH